MRIRWWLRMAAAQREVWTETQLRWLPAERAELEAPSRSVSALFSKIRPRLSCRRWRRCAPCWSARPTQRPVRGGYARSSGRVAGQPLPAQPKVAGTRGRRCRRCEQRVEETGPSWGSRCGTARTSTRRSSIGTGSISAAAGGACGRPRRRRPIQDTARPASAIPAPGDACSARGPAPAAGIRCGSRTAPCAETAADRGSGSLRSLKEVAAGTHQCGRELVPQAWAGTLDLFRDIGGRSESGWAGWELVLGLGSRGPLRGFLPYG